MNDRAPAYPKRLIEVDLPIARISEHARREKSIRHGHISTLHLWWARRPLAACRVVMLERRTHGWRTRRNGRCRGLVGAPRLAPPCVASLRNPCVRRSNFGHLPEATMPP